MKDDTITFTIPCNICSEDIEWEEDNAMYRGPKPFPICENCLETLREIIKEKQTSNR